MGYSKQSLVSEGGVVAQMSVPGYTPARNLVVTLNADGLVLLPVATGSYAECNVTLVQGAGGYVGRFGANVAWEGGAEPIPPLLGGDFAHYRLVSNAAGSTWYGARLTSVMEPKVFDRFDRANSASSLGTAEVGGAWTAHSGTWGISSKSAYVVTRSGDTVASVDVGVTDYTMSCRITAGSSQSQPGLAFRVVDSSNLLLVNFSNPSSPTQVCAFWKVVAGVYTQLGSLTHPTPILTVGQSTLIAIKNIGSELELYIRGVMVLSVTDSTHGSATRVGLRINDAYSAGCRWDDLVVI